MKFRRNTHTLDGRYKDEIFGRDKESHFQKKVWAVHGDIAHHLPCDKGLSYEDILQAVRNDVTNYSYHPADLQEWVEGGTLPTPEYVALSLVRLLEANFVEMVGD
jgi:hypothetical protein